MPKHTGIPIFLTIGSAAILLAACSATYPSASSSQVGEMLDACGFVERDVRPQVPGDDHLVVNIWSSEPGAAAKRSCLEAEIQRRQLLVGIAGPAADNKGS